ncbi:MAG: type III-A CRISPR-associated RAMP protein Csm5 [Bacteroidota bacterium]
MSNSVLHFSVQTLSPIHIGSGRELQGNYEYLYFPSHKKIALIDESKVLGILGEAHINQWLSIIDKGESLLALLKDRSRELAPVDIAQRIIEVGEKALGTEGNIREQFHDGMGYPLLPGSSLKGGIRTAFVTQKILGEYGAPKKMSREKLGFFKKNNPQKFQWKDNGLENDFLAKGVSKGTEPNHDLFRLLRPGDIRFSHTEVFRLITLNKHHDGWKDDTKISTLIEVIPPQQEGYLRLLNPKETLINYLKREKCKFSFPLSPTEMEWKHLSYLVNKHSQRRLEEELAFWEAEASSSLTISYKEALMELHQKSQHLKEGACMLQIGFGSGINGITGGWQKTAMDPRDYQGWVSSFRKSAPQLAFPKTRKVSPTGYPLGYIVLKPLDCKNVSAFKSEWEQRRKKKLTEHSQGMVPQKILPQYPLKSKKIKRGMLLDAFVFKKQEQPKRKRIHVYVKKGKEIQVDIPYPSDAILGKIIEVEVIEIKDGKVSQVKFKRIKTQNR